MKFFKYSIFTLGAITLLLLTALYGKSAVQTISGLAVAQSPTNWKFVKDAAFGDNATDGVLASSPYLYDGVNFDPARGDTTNGMDVDVTRIPAIVGDNTPADAYTTPTDAQDVQAFLSGYNGTTHDLLRSGGNNVNNTTPLSTGILEIKATNYEFDGTTWDRVTNHFFQTTTGITTDAGGGTTLITGATTTTKYTMIIDRTAGATDVIEVHLECSLDNVIFSNTNDALISVTTTANEPTRNSFDGAPCRGIRYNVVTVGAGNTLTIQILAAR